MESLTILLLAACLVYGGVVLLYRRADSRAYSMAMVLSVLAVGAVGTDAELVGSDSSSYALAIVAPIAVLIYSLGGMLIDGRRRQRWRRRSRRRIC